MLFEILYSIEDVILESTLFVRQDNIYRVMYKEDFRPVVNILELQSLRNGISVSVGEAVNQDWIPSNRLGAFRIQGDVYFNAKGFVYQTDLKIEADQTSDVDLQAWDEDRG